MLILLRLGRSEFLLRAGRRESADRGARRIKTARAWPRAAQHKSIACLNMAKNLLFVK